MLATHALSLSSLAPTARPCLRSRPAFADSTNVNSGGPGDSNGVSFVARTYCGWSHFEPPTGFTSHSPHHPLSCTPSLFPATYKAPPSVCISLSAACSQSIPRASSGSRVEPDLPDVRSVVPFPSASPDGDMDVDMVNESPTHVPEGHLPSAGQAPRKRRSAYSSVSSSQGSQGKDPKPKRQRKSRRQVADLCWLGVVHRSILRRIDARHSARVLDASDRLLSPLHDLDAMDRVLVEKIHRRLTENGCVEGRALPNPLPRISSPSISVPSLNLLAPSRKTPPIDSAILTAELSSKDNSALDGIAPCPSTRASLSITPVQSPTDTSHGNHVRSGILQRPRQSQRYPSILRRSLSPPVREGTVSANGPMLTLTMPQLVAALILAYHERSRLRSRERTYKVTECGKNAGRSLPSVPCKAVQCRDGDVIHDKSGMRQSSTPRARLSNAPERKSPLSRIAYTAS